MPPEHVTSWGLDEMIGDFRELEHVEFKAIGRLEKLLAEAFEASQAIVHVLSGGLKISGTPHTSFDGDTWTGGIDYAYHPGIFELALGDSPSIFHPEGQHGDFLTKAVDPFADKIGHVIDEIVIEALGPPEGGTPS